jgi:hypothetical protein
MKALSLYAGPAAREHIRRHGLQAAHIRTIAAAAGGPKGLILGALDRYLFGVWLPRSTQPIDLVGASIGAWRMATACLDDPLAAFERLEHDYIHQHYEFRPGNRLPAPALVSAEFARSLRSFYGGREQQVLQHPRYRLHVVTSRGRHLLGREQGWRTPLGYLGAFLTNTVRRRAMGIWLERVVFSVRLAADATSPCAPLPFATSDYRTRQVALDAGNFYPAIQASCSIPFALQAVHDIPGAPRGAYWDGGITDYHLHLNYAGAPDAAQRPGLVLYPHFQRAVVPGWLDKALKWRHRSTHFLDNVLLLAPHPDWVRSLPNAKLPDRKDFSHYGNDLAARVRVWSQAVRMSVQLAEEFEAWLQRPDVAQLQPL